MINYSLLMDQRLSAFYEVVNSLPMPEEIPAELLVVSAGMRRGSWSFLHVFTDGDTIYFIFRKSGMADGLKATWECVDRELELLAQEQMGNKAVSV